MKHYAAIDTTVTLSLSLFLVASAPVVNSWLNTAKAQAVQLSDGTVFFDRPPRLMNAFTSNDRADAWNATYYFTLSLPENAGEPLAAVIIHQHDGLSQIRYKLEKTTAFTGTYRDRGAPLPIAEVSNPEHTHALRVRFDPPVPPGTTVTIAIEPLENPRQGGIYQFGVTAFPPAEKPHGQFLGYRRLHFYQNTPW
jgi:hypothetical protein